MRYSHQRKLVLISNWKCGCSTIAELFSGVTEFDWSSRQTCLDTFGKDYDEMVHYPAGLMRQEFRRLGWDFDGYVKISSVRNPWARAVSLYEHVQRDGWRGTFEEFLCEELPNWRSGLIYRWNSYEMFHENGRRIVDHVIRLEHLEDDLRPIVESKWPDLQLDYATRANVGRHKPFRDYYTNDRSRELVEQFFTYDIEAYGYGFDDPLAQ